MSAVNVGWLEPEEEYETGDVPDGFAEALATVVRDFRQMKMRGWHSCRLPHVGYTEPYPSVFDVGGQRIFLGGAEVRVISKSGEWMIAPDLVLHYVSKHSYKPSMDFIEAVMQRRTAPTG